MRGTRPIARENDEERKPDLFIAHPLKTVSPSPYTPVISPSLCLRNPHQTLCAIGTATSIQSGL